MKTKRTRLFFITLLLMFTILTVSASANEYKLKDVNGKTAYVPLVSKGFTENTYVFWDKDAGTLVKKSLTYNKKQLTIEAFERSLSITPKKTGTFNVSFKMKKNGKTTKYSFKVKSFKLSFQTKPFTSFKFGSKRLDVKDYGGVTYPAIELYNYTLALGTKKILTKGTDTGKFSIKLRKGWSIKSAVMEYSNGKTKKVSLSGKIKFTKKDDISGDRLYITFKSAKGNEVVFVVVGYMNN